MPVLSDFSEAIMPQSKRHVDDKRYSLLSTQSILAYAESGGHSEIAEEVAAVLSEDVVYRLREVIQVNFMFHLHCHM